MSKDIVLKITLSNGKVLVDGPIEDQILCFGLLEVSKQLIVKFNADREHMVQPAATVPPIVNGTSKR